MNQTIDRLAPAIKQLQRLDTSKRQEIFLIAMLTPTKAELHIIDTALVQQTARRISITLAQPARRLSGMVNQLSQRSLLSGNGPKKEIHFDQSPTVHTYPSAQSFLPDDDLWYTQEECNRMITDDVEMILQTEKRGEICTRGLESLCNPVRVFRKGATKRYVMTMVRKDCQHRELTDKFIISKRKAIKRMNSLNRYSVQVTACDKTFAYQLACDDEKVARAIYEEDIKAAEDIAATVTPPKASTKLEFQYSTTAKTA